MNGNEEAACHLGLVELQAIEFGNLETPRKLEAVLEIIKLIEPQQAIVL
jgi:hypothetical protein